jgi:hypothetical protein
MRGALAERFKCKRQLVPKPDAPVAAEQGPQATTHAKTAQKHPEAAPGAKMGTAKAKKNPPNASTRERAFLETALYAE